MYPERVIREPLTDEDRALGYTAGRILVLDASTMNAARYHDRDARRPAGLDFSRVRRHAAHLCGGNPAT